MWVVVVFVVGDVSSVPLSWILRINGTIMCYWPLNNPRDKIKKNCKPPDSPNESWQLYECRILFREATFKSYKAALQNEKYAQNHSNLESQEESDANRAEKRKHPKTKFSSDSDEEQSTHPKRTKLITKKSTKFRKQPSKRSQQPLPSSDESDDNEYVFIKNAPESSENVLHSANVEPIMERDETLTPFVGGGILESVGDTNTTCDQHINIVLVNDDGNRTDETQKSTPDAVVQSDENLSDDSPVNTIDDIGSRGQHIEVIFGNDDEEQAIETTNKTSDIVQLDSEQVQLICSGTENIHLESIDFSDHIGGTILQKLAEILQNQNDFKKVLVDLTYRTMKMEQRIKKLSSTPTKAIVKQLGCPVKTKEQFAEIMVALEDDDNYDSLVTLVSSFQAPSVNEFVKAFLKEMLDQEFLYNHIVWRAEANKVVIKNTKLAHCMFDAIKMKFPEVKEKKMEEDAINATRQLKDCYRKKKK